MVEVVRLAQLLVADQFPVAVVVVQIPALHPVLALLVKSTLQSSRRKEIKRCQHTLLFKTPITSAIT
jgi:hypothetical protein